MTVIDGLPEWLKETAAVHPYAEIALNLKVHDGQMRYLTKSVTEKIQLSEKDRTPLTNGSIQKRKH